MSLDSFRRFGDQRAVRHDHLFRWVLCLDCPFGRSVGRAAILTLTIPLLLVCVALFVDHNFRLKSGAIGLSQDWNIIAMFAVFPIALLVLRLTIRRFGSFIRSIPDQTYHRPAVDGALSAVYEKIDGMFAAKRMWFGVKSLFYLFGLAYVIYNAYNRCYRPDQFYFGDFWTSCAYQTTYWVTNAYTSLVWGYLIPSISFVIFTILLAVCRIATVLRKEGALRLELLSADRMGGLRPLSRLALSLAYIIIPFQLQLATYALWIPKLHPPFYIGLSFTVFLSALLFSIPIFYIHRAMRRSKIAALEELGLEARKNYALLRGYWDGGADLTKEALVFQRIRQIKEMYDIVDATHVWPFDVRVISRLLGAIVIGLVPLALRGLYEWWYLP